MLEPFQKTALERNRTKSCAVWLMGFAVDTQRQLSEPRSKPEMLLGIQCSRFRLHRLKSPEIGLKIDLAFLVLMLECFHAVVLLSAELFIWSRLRGLRA